MDQETSRIKLTYDDFVLFPDDGKRHELIDGEHYVTPSPVTKHQRIVVRLVTALGSFLENKPLGEIFAAPFDVILSRADVVQPDILYVSRDRSEIVTDPNVQGAPDLVVEVLSPGTRRRDLGIKRRLYERSGIREYWIVDPDRETVAVLRRRDGQFAEAVPFSRDGAACLETPLLPGFSVELDRVFGE